jgi:RNA polymerase sigma-70 factor (ECF subfamily)
MHTEPQKEMSLQEMGLRFYQSRQENDFTRVYNRLRPSISYYLRELVPQQDDRNEVIATTFAKVWNKIEQYDPYWNFSTWVYRIARNEALLFHRGRKKTYSYEAMEEKGINMEKHSAYDQIFEHEEDPIDSLYDQAVIAIQDLPEIYRTVLTLREIQKKKYEDIAEELGWKHNTVRTRIRKARELVRVNLLKKDPELVKKYQQSI